MNKKHANNTINFLYITLHRIYMHHALYIKFKLQDPESRRQQPTKATIQNLDYPDIYIYIYNMNSFPLGDKREGHI